MLPVVALTCRVPGCSAPALKDRERRVAVSCASATDPSRRPAGFRPWRRPARARVSSSLANDGIRRSIPVTARTGEDSSRWLVISYGVAYSCARAGRGLPAPRNAWPGTGRPWMSRWFQLAVAIGITWSLVHARQSVSTDRADGLSNHDGSAPRHLDLARGVYALDRRVAGGNRRRANATAWEQETTGGHRGQ
jgi:hypothetical protein